MYLGKIVELADANILSEDARHPYTQALLAAAPNPDPSAKRTREPLKGEPPSPINPPAGCRFHPRCEHVMDRCKTDVPPIFELPGGHRARCFLAEDDAVGTVETLPGPIAV